MDQHGQVHAAGGFVEQDKPRSSHERHRGIEQFLLAVTQQTDLLIGKMRQAEELDHPLRGIAEPGIGGADQA